jgi:hypothetical protein
MRRAPVDISKEMQDLMHFHSVILTQGQSLLASSGNSVIVQGMLNLAKNYTAKKCRNTQYGKKVQGKAGGVNFPLVEY